MEPAATGTSEPPPPRTPLATDTTGAATVAAAAPTAASVLLAAAAASLVAVGLGGAALLVWWALAFHRANARLWMVPAGLVLLGTLLIAWLSVFSSGPCGRRRVPPPAVSGA